MYPEAAELLDIWFADCGSDSCRVADQSRLWFEPSAEQDEFLRQRCGLFLERAARGELEIWKGSPQSCLALVIVFDQLPRSLFRGRAEAFAYDDRALQVSQRGVTSGYLEKLQPIEQAFLLMPYQHSESLTVQYEGVSLFESVTEAAQGEWRDLLRGFLGFARQHLEIIERFGRFPHRNRVLDRQSTPEEDHYLVSGGATFGQG